MVPRFASGIRALCSACLTLLLVGPTYTQASTQDPDVLSQKAETAFDAGRFSEASAIYRSLATAGIQNGHLFYNFGVSLYKEGRTGESLAAFLNARNLLPRDPDVAANIRHIVSKSGNPRAAESSGTYRRYVGFWLDGFSLSEFTWGAAATAFVLGVTITILYRRQQLQRRRLWVLAAFCLPLLLAASALARFLTDPSWGATQYSTKVHSGPGETNTLLFELPEAMPVMVFDQSTNNWFRIELSDGKKGWISGENLAFFGLLPGGPARRPAGQG